MKWFRALLGAFLVIGMLLSSSLVVYADDGEEGDEGDGDGEEGDEDGDEEVGEEDEGGLVVDIVVIGDNPKVGIDIIGEDAKVTVNTTGTEIYLDGQNINEPTVYYKTTVRSYWIENSYDDTALKGNISNLETLLEEAGVKLDLAGSGLAKVILVIGEHTDSLYGLLELVNQSTENSISRDDELVASGESRGLVILQLGDKLTILKGSLEDYKLSSSETISNLEDYKLSSSETISNLEADFQIALSDMDARVDELDARIAELSSDFNTKLVWTWSGFGAFWLLLLGIWRLWQLRLSRD